jgi:hypothetical protein
MSQLARSPFCATSNAPKIVTSICPPRIIAIDDRCPRPQRDASAPGIDQIGIGLVLFGERPDADHAILGLEDDVYLGPQIVRAVHRQPDAEIDHLAVLDVLRGAPGDLQAIERAHTATTRST